MKLLRILTVAVALAALAAGARGQTLVKTIPETVRQTFTNLAGASTPVTNIGQSFHYVRFVCNPCKLQIQATYDLTNWFPISDEVGFRTLAGLPAAAVSAFGFFPAVRINVTSGTATTVSYSGTSESSDVAAGIFNRSTKQIVPFLLEQNIGTGIVTSVFNVPFGTTGGLLVVEPEGAGFPAATCLIIIEAVWAQTFNTVGRYPLAAGARKQVFSINAMPAQSLRITYSACGASADVFSVSSYFYQPTMPTEFVGASLSNATSSQFESPVHEASFACAQSAVIEIAGAGTVQIVAPVSRRIVRICHLSLAFDGATNIQIIRGTGATCGTGTANMTGNYRNLTSLTLDFGNKAALRTPNGNSLAPPADGDGVCIVTSGAVNGGGVVTFAQF